MNQRGLLNEKYNFFKNDHDWWVGLSQRKLQVILSTPVRIDGEEPSLSVSLDTKIFFFELAKSDGDGTQPT